MCEITYTIDSAQSLTIVVAKGIITGQDVKDAISQYAAEEHTDKVLWNFLEADATRIKKHEYRAIHLHGASLFQDKPNRKVAVVVSRPVGYGLSRMSGMYAETLNPNTNYRTFHSIDEAMNWLDDN